MIDKEKIERTWEDFKSANYLHQFLFRWVIYIIFCVSLLTIAKRYQAHRECEYLLYTYAVETSIGYNTRMHGVVYYHDELNIELKKHKDPWGDSYYLKFNKYDGQETIRIYSKNGGYGATKTIKI